MFQDAAVSAEIRSILPRVVELTVQGFVSRIWHVRNASLVMFGTLLPRLLGTSSNADMDEESFKAVTSRDLFERFAVSCCNFPHHYITLCAASLNCTHSSCASLALFPARKIMHHWPRRFQYSL